MKKVAIVTIESKNFGNRLQNYALQTLLESFDFKVETLRRGTKPTVKEKLKIQLKLCGQKIFKTKESKFNSFDKKINKSNIYVNANNVSKTLYRNYDFFISGSDQVWNPHYTFTGTTDLLMFAKPEQSISYAGSFGVESIPDEQKEMYRKGLNGFKSISVRESAGAKIVEELTGIKAEIVLDPTLMISAEQWRKVEKAPDNCPKGKYVLVCALGKKNDTFNRAVEVYGKNYKIYDIFAKNKYGKDIAIGPAEFLYLIDHAEMILTDSFHTTAFSILFRKKVRTFNRPGINMNSRIVTLSEVTGLSNCMKDGSFFVDDEYRYENVDEILDKARAKSLNFLKEALDIRTL